MGLQNGLISLGGYITNYNKHLQSGHTETMTSTPDARTRGRWCALELEPTPVLSSGISLSLSMGWFPGVGSADTGETPCPDENQTLRRLFSGWWECPPAPGKIPSQIKIYNNPVIKFVLIFKMIINVAAGAVTEKIVPDMAWKKSGRALWFSFFFIFLEVLRISSRD